MIIENFLEPFGQWIGPALYSWALVILVLVVAAVVIGGFVAVVRNGPIRGLIITALAMRDGVIDIFCMSPRRVWGLTWLSVRDSIRRRVLVVFLFFLVLLLFAGWFLDPSSEHPLRLYISFILTATSYLVLLLVLFLSAFSIPNELKNKTLHTVVTKPVRASEIVLGRMLGFTLIGTFLLCVMGLISYVFVVRGL
ncbi:MAG: ABC transporter permease, partial [Planctomycetia bacterium]